MYAPAAVKLTAVPEANGVMAEPHPVPSIAIPSCVVRTPEVFVIANVGVLLPSRLTVKAETVEVPDTQLPISVPAPAGGVFWILRVAQFWWVAKVNGGTVTAGKT